MGVQNEEVIIETISVKPLAKSEDDRLEYMLNAELKLDSTERFISILIDSCYVITGAIIEQNTCMRQLGYTTNDFAYVQDIAALNKKIDVLATIPFE